MEVSFRDGLYPLRGHIKDGNSKIPFDNFIAKNNMIYIGVRGEKERTGFENSFLIDMVIEGPEK